MKLKKLLLSFLTIALLITLVITSSLATAQETSQTQVYSTENGTPQNITDAQKQEIIQKYQMSIEFVNDLSDAELQPYLDKMDSLVGVSKRDEYYRYDVDISDSNNVKSLGSKKVTFEEALNSVEISEKGYQL
ncbi:hypothetical protein NQ117_07065 [Paenibacillus sp. SC116]|uniref:hypothetical protein n=1 Tax=Paenibacillus sp. SC116 TaxID=2968986 RepID=UPI00215ACA22|nr:hypothetical protein [Paenibacillus sp. SC116]MCR8843439.1 hypothetical protein [Paenibacillus sp. SC116]